MQRQHIVMYLLFKLRALQESHFCTIFVIFGAEIVERVEEQVELEEQSRREEQYGQMVSNNSDVK